MSTKNSLMKHLENHGLNKEILRKILIRLWTNVASIMLGKLVGLAMLMKGFPTILTSHCINRLELAVYDSLKHVTTTNHFVVFDKKRFVCLQRI